ncbi:hypothetical protein GW17_00034590 [Ensete ventricosum]|nr:hypothetical protein GW17_00034590 [Ensete ventricosum]
MGLKFHTGTVYRALLGMFSTLLDLEGFSGDCIGEESQPSKCIYGGRTRYKLFSKTEYSKGDDGFRNF